MNLLRLFMLALLLSAIFSANAQSTLTWQEINTVEQVCQAYPGRMDTLLQNLNLETPGLEAVKTAHAAGQLAQACTQLLNYYQTGETARFLRRDLPAATSQTDSYADSILQDIFTVQLQASRSPRTADGRLDWHYTGTRDDIEWAWGVNRHYHIRTLLDVYFRTGNPKYAQTIDQHIKDWVISSLPYPAKKSSTAMWRGLEVSFRAKMWANVFFHLMHSEHLSPATRLLLMSSLPEHAHYLRSFHAQGNWLTMEMSGLAMIAVAWPEFKLAPAWIAYAKEAMSESMKEQVYPDGVQSELSSSYHEVALNNFALFLETLQQAGESLPETYTAPLEQMWHYLAYTVRPNGYGLLNNDSDLRSNREKLLLRASQYNRPDWLYLATNGNHGVRPEGPPSVLFPWAGQLIMRSDYDADAHWAFFDIGPWGSGHQHNDKLHLSVSAYGRDLLVDGGRFAYRGEIAQKFRRYALGSESHNVLLIDGKGQAPGPKVTESPLDETQYRLTADFDYARGDFDAFNDLEGSAKHSRAVHYVRGKYWIVVDHVATDRPREIEALWHWHPDCVPTLKKGQVVATDQVRGNLSIIPAGKQQWNVALVRGQETPQIQGWYSPEYNRAEPATASIYSTRIEENTAFVWILYPSEGAAPAVKARIVSRQPGSLTVRVKDADGKREIEVKFLE